MSELKQIVKELDFQQNFVGNMFLKPPENNFARVNIFGEISCLTGFFEENWYLFYEFALPWGWKVDNENDYYMIYEAENLKEDNITKLKSISQTSNAYVNPNVFSYLKPDNYLFTVCDTPHLNHEDDIKDSLGYVHNFSIPFELELLGHWDALGTWDPKLWIQINSIDSWERHRTEGYCFLPIQTKTGSINVEVPCYKPQEDNYMKIFSYFWGGSRKIPEWKELAKTASVNDSNVDTIWNRYGIMTEHSGSVHVNLNCVVQSEEVMEKARKVVKEKECLEDYNFVLGIQSALGQKVASIKNIGQAETTDHGLIPRYDS